MPAQRHDLIVTVLDRNVARAARRFVRAERGHLAEVREQLDGLRGRIERLQAEGRRL
ncbi:MAG TPA: hypothetical protein VN783_14395 [Thermoanaerobaculia bacterium]|nr:hypothetical protein [Thermoanaerobaculia bacterium]